MPSYNKKDFKEKNDYTFGSPKKIVNSEQEMLSQISDIGVLLG